MTVIKREDVPQPVRKKETIACPDLNSDVVVQQMTLQQFLETTRVSSTRHNTAQMAAILADCVLAEDGLPLWTEEQWNAWGPGHQDAVFVLYTKVRELSGIPIPPEKLDDTAKN